MTHYGPPKPPPPAPPRICQVHGRYEEEHCPACEVERVPQSAATSGPLLLAGVHDELIQQINERWKSLGILVREHAECFDEARQRSSAGLRDALSKLVDDLSQVQVLHKNLTDMIGAVEKELARMQAAGT